jgi:hypothetical protein
VPARFYGPELSRRLNAFQSQNDETSFEVSQVRKVRLPPLFIFALTMTNEKYDMKNGKWFF